MWGGWFENPWGFSRALPLLRLVRAKFRSNDDWLIGWLLVREPCGGEVNFSSYM